MKIDTDYIKVAVALPVEQTYTYAVPAHFAEHIVVGKRVLVPFGRRSVTGYVLGPTNKPAFYKVKLILDVLDPEPLFPASMLALFKWVAEYYIYPLGLVIRNALPGGLNLQDALIATITDKGRQALAQNKLTSLQKSVLKTLTQGPCSLKKISHDLKRPISSGLIYNMEQKGFLIHARKLQKTIQPFQERYISLNQSVSDPGRSKIKAELFALLKKDTELAVSAIRRINPGMCRQLKSLEKQGVLKITLKTIYRDPFGNLIPPDTPPDLNPEQKNAVAAITAKMTRPGFHAFLMAGVTGSGKTEVYLNACARALKLKRSVIMLVPEIALISQTESRFRARFGECVAVLHSGLSAGQRYDQWVRIAGSGVSIVVGARSAIFAPLINPGLIIVDEEHDTSYKQENDLLYNARDLALVRAKLAGITVVLGSATPSVQACHNVIQGKNMRLDLRQRINQRPLPTVTMIDLRTAKPGQIITPQLRQAMQTTLARGEQSLLFLNRRGYAGFPVCAVCGHALICKYCDITLTFHKAAHAYKCHYCGFSKPDNSLCTQCGSPRIKRLGMGTEKIESIVRELFPEARIARLDRDTTARKGMLLKILKSLRNREIDILIGTQMVAKGHDFEHITLVGIICADLSLSFPDFRSCERTFQVLAQVAGRAGRGQACGHVIMQTYNPEHFSIISAQNQDFEDFFQKEIKLRAELNYPPFSRLALLKISGQNFNKVHKFAGELGDAAHGLGRVEDHFKHHLRILGPIEAQIPRIANRYYWQILIKSPGSGLLHCFVNQLRQKNPTLFNQKKIKIVIDIDPYFI